MMPPFVLKAIPSDHPHRRQLGKLEREAQTILQSALQRLRDDLFDGIDRENIYELLPRLQSQTINERLRQSVYEALILAAGAGGQAGQAQIERDVFGVKAAPITIDWTLVNSAVAEWAKQQSFLLTYANVWSITNSMESRLRTEIDNFIRTPDLTIDELGRRLIPLFDDTRAEMIAITEVTRAFAEGNRLAWKESGVVERKQWNTANDELVCPICGPLNGTVVDIDGLFDSNYDGPPAHPRCRCWITPVVSVPE